MGSVCTTSIRLPENPTGAKCDNMCIADDLRVHHTQKELDAEAVPDLDTESSAPTSKLARLRSLLQVDLEGSWRLIRTLEEVLETPPRLERARCEAEQVEDLLLERDAYAEELVQRLHADFSAVRDLTTASWLKLAVQLQKTNEDLPEGCPRHMPELAQSLGSLLARYRTLSDGYVHLSSAASGPLSASEIRNLQLDLRAAENRKEHYRDVLVRLEEKNRALLSSSIAARTEEAVLKGESECRRKETSETEAEIEQLSKCVAELEDDISVKRELLVHQKKELADMTAKNEELQREVEQLKAQQGETAEIARLEEEKRALALRLGNMEEDLACRQTQAALNKKKLEQLESSLRNSEERVSNTGDIDARMLNMQSTLREIYKSIEDNTEDDCDDDLE